MEISNLRNDFLKRILSHFQFSLHTVSIFFFIKHNNLSIIIIFCCCLLCMHATSRWFMQYIRLENECGCANTHICSEFVMHTTQYLSIVNFVIGFGNTACVYTKICVRQSSQPDSMLSFSDARLLRCIFFSAM